MKHTASYDEENDTLIEIDLNFIDETYSSVVSKVVKDDPFQKVNVLNQGSEIKKLYNDLKKRLRGIEGAESKYQDPEQVNGYSLYNVVEPPYDLEALGNLYDENPILHAVIDSRVMNTVGLGFDFTPTLKAKKQIEKGTKSIEASNKIRTAHQKEVEGLNEKFDTLNEEETFVEVMIRIWLDVLALGNGYMEIGRTNVNKIGYIGYVPARLVRVRRPRDGFVQTANQKAVFFKNFGDQEAKDIINNDSKPNEMLHFKLYTPNNSYYGIPPCVSALAAIVGDKFAKEFNIDYFENKAIPRYAIILKGVKLSEKSKRELINYFRNEVKGKNHGTLVVPIPSTIGSQSEADVKFEKLENEVQEASFEKYRKANRDEIITAYRVPPTKVGVFEAANLAIARDADKTFKVQVVGPDQVIIEKRINRIVKEFSDLFKLKFNQLDVLDEDMRSRIHDRYARIEVMDPNEIRQAIGLQPREGADKVLPYPVKPPAYWGGKETWGEDLTSSGGGQTGNQNANQPPKSEQDSGRNASNADDAGTNQERGQSQENGAGRENREQ